MNSDFIIRPLKVELTKSRLGLADASPSLFPRFVREEVMFKSMAPAWLLNGLRAVLFSYVTTKRLKVIKETYSCTDHGIMQEFLITTVENIMCHKNTPVSAKYMYSAQSGTDAVMMLQTANFTPIHDSNAIKDAFESSMLIGTMNVRSKISFEVVVVEEPAYKSPVKPIEKNFVFYPAAALTVYRANDDANIVFEQRVELDQPPYLVRYIAHGYHAVDSYEPLREAVRIAIAKLAEWQQSLRSGSAKITVGGMSASGETELVWIVDEPLDHISSLLRGQLLLWPKKYLAVIMQHNHITVTTAFRLVFAGTRDEMVVDLAERLKETIDEVAKFNLPATR